MSTSNTSAGGGVELSTLIITAVASAAAAYVTSEVWAPGTLASAALTPIIVALVKEALSRPARAVTRAVPVRGVVRSTSPEDEAAKRFARYEPVDERVAQHGEIAGSSGSFRRRAWQTAVVTGLLGFLVAAVIITVPEVVAGKAASGGGHTTLFGGEQRSSTPATTTTTTTTEQTETAPPTQTLTIPPVETTTVPPAQTTTVPPETTTPPGDTTTVPPDEGDLLPPP
jgi:hypothetical protein